MKKYVPLILVVLLVAIGIGITVANKDDSSNPKSNSTISNKSSNNNSSHENMNSSTSSGNSSPVATNEVEIEDFNFTPSDITVKLGTTVKWTNKDDVAHTVTSDSGSKMNSELLNKGQSYSVTFTEAGTFEYHCTPHPNMRAKVTVVQ